MLKVRAVQYDEEESKKIFDVQNFPDACELARQIMDRFRDASKEAQKCAALQIIQIPQENLNYDTAVE